MYIFDEVDFFVIWRMRHREKWPGTEVSQMGKMGHFLGGSRHPKGALCKVTAL